MGLNQYTNSRTVKSLMIGLWFFVILLLIYLGYIWENINFLISGFSLLIISIIPFIYLLVIPRYYVYSKSRNIIPDVNSVHHAIIVAPQKRDHILQNWRIYSSGIDILVNWCKGKDQQYCIYECNSPEDIEGILSNKEAKYLWIFAEGAVNGFYLKNGQYGFRDNLKEGSKKDFIGLVYSSKDFSGNQIDSMLINPGNKFLFDQRASVIRFREILQSFLVDSESLFIIKYTAPECLFNCDRALKLPETDDDILCYSPYAKRIAYAIMGMFNKDGFVLSINGEWGSGKTTFINFIKYYLTHYETSEIKGVLRDNHKIPIIVDYEPWFYSGKEEILKQFLIKLKIKLSENKNISPELISLIADYIMILCPVNIPVGKTIEHIYKNNISQNEDAVLIREKIKKKLPKNQYIVFFIDDIDRLEPYEMKNLFQIVKAIGNFPNVVYVLSYDKKIVESLLFEGNSDKSADYLEKIVQMSYNLPPSSTNVIFHQLTGLLNDFFSEINLFKLDEQRWYSLFDVGISKIIKTQRDILRLENSLKITYNAVRKEVNPTDFLCLEVIRLWYPDIYFSILDNISYFYPVNIRFLDDEWKTEFSSYFANLNKELSDKGKSYVFNLLKALYPVIERYQDSSPYSSKSLKKEYNLFEVDYIDRYFWLQFSDYHISSNDLNEFFTILSQKSRDEIKVAFEKITAIGSLFSPKKAEYLLRHLYQNIDRLDIKEPVEGIIAINRFVSEFKMCDNNFLNQTFSPFKLLINYELYKKTDGVNGINKIEDEILNSDQFRLYEYTLEIDKICKKNDYPLTTMQESDRKYVVDPAILEKLKKTISGKISSLAYSNELFKLQIRRSLFLAWVNFSASEVNDWILSNSGIPFVLDVSELFVSHIEYEDGSSETPINMEECINFIGKEKLALLVKEISEDKNLFDSLSNDQKSTYSLLKKNEDILFG